jgi:hypothetical protein
MNSRITFVLLSIFILAVSCKKDSGEDGINIIYLHHSTGNVIWEGRSASTLVNRIKRMSWRAGKLLEREGQLSRSIKKHNRINGTNYRIERLAFPKDKPYGWDNYPYDYYNIWVKNAGDNPYMEEPTLEILTRDYDVIIFKHCFPASNIKADLDSADINSDIRTLSNYKLQYNALKEKMKKFPENRFILFTGAVQVKSKILEEEALRATEFNKWVLDEWDTPDDNIYLWDLYRLQTEGGLYFKDEYAVSATDSHPNEEFAARVCELLQNRIYDVIENHGAKTSVTGEFK